MNFKIKTLQILCVVLLCNTTIAQQKRSTQQEMAEYVYDISYGVITRQLFEKEIYSYEEDTIDFAERMLVSKTTVDDIKSAIDSVIQNATIKINNKDFGEKLIFESRFPSFYNEYKPRRVVKIKLYDVKLSDSENKQVLLTDPNVLETNVGYDHEYIVRNNEEIRSDFIRIYRDDLISNMNEMIKPIKGYASYTFGFITDYKSKRLSKKDIGKNFKLGKYEFKLIDVFENKLVVDCITAHEYYFTDELKLIVLNNDGTKELVTYYTSSSPSKERRELLRNRKIKLWETSPRKGKLIEEDIFHFFKKHKGISKEEYKELFPLDRYMEAKESGKHYMVLTARAPIENDFILYMPVYGVSEEVKVKF